MSVLVSAAWWLESFDESDDGESALGGVFEGEITVLVGAEAGEVSVFGSVEWLASVLVASSGLAEACDVGVPEALVHGLGDEAVGVDLEGDESAGAFGIGVADTESDLERLILLLVSGVVAVEVRSVGVIGVGSNGVELVVEESVGGLDTDSESEDVLGVLFAEFLLTLDALEALGVTLSACGSGLFV